MLLVLDNYDSFTYNLVYLLQELGVALEVHRNDRISLAEVDRFDRILLSPGPGLPAEAGIMMALIRQYAPTKSILGVCLGHQGIGEAFGGQLHNLGDVLHGVATPLSITQPDERLFRAVPDQVLVGRYHSWTVTPEDFPADLRVTAVDAQGRVMALAHRRYDVRGVQFHPESILTQHGKTMLANWLAA